MGDEIEINVDTEALPDDNSEDDTTEIVVNDAEVIEENPVEVNVIIEDEDNTAEWETVQEELQKNQLAQAVAEATTDLSLEAQILQLSERQQATDQRVAEMYQMVAELWASRQSDSNPTPAETTMENPDAESADASPPIKRGRRSKTLLDWLT